MKINPSLITAAVFAAVAIVFLALAAIQQPFPVFSSSANQTSSFVGITQDVGAQDSRFLWTNSGYALVAQAFVLLAAAAATLGLSRLSEANSNA